MLNMLDFNMLDLVQVPDNSNLMLHAEDNPCKAPVSNTGV